MGRAEAGRALVVAGSREVNRELTEAQARGGAALEQDQDAGSG